MEIGNVKFLEIRIGKEHDSRRKDFGITFIFHNQNNFAVNLYLSFSKHIYRNDDGTYDKDITPKFDSLTIPANEKIKRYVELGRSFPTNESDLRLQDIFLETIFVKDLNGSILGKSENANFQIYSKEDISKVSTLTGRKISQTIVSGVAIYYPAGFVISDDSSIPFLVKLLCFAFIFFIISRTFKMWKRPYINKKGLYSKIMQIAWGYDD